MVWLSIPSRSAFHVSPTEASVDTFNVIASSYQNGFVRALSIAPTSDKASSAHRASPTNAGRPSAQLRTDLLSWTMLMLTALPFTVDGFRFVPELLTPIYECRSGRHRRRGSGIQGTP